ncbi:hypothetical protein B4U84_26530 [Westiellopsis prolifica IICB1]|nr:hypothetical protein B4U84_26530 [Westiellopsis prolifica IICB1]
MSSSSTQVTSTSSPSPRETFSKEKIQNWLRCYVADLLSVNANKIDITVPFDRYGLDSSSTIGMLADLEDWLAHRLEPTLVYDYPTIQSLAKHLDSELNQERHVSN